MIDTMCKGVVIAVISVAASILLYIVLLSLVKFCQAHSTVLSIAVGVVASVMFIRGLYVIVRRRL